VKKGDITVVLTTHYMEEAEKLSSRVAIIDHGKVQVVDTPSNLKSALEGDVITVQCSSVDHLSERLKTESGVTNVRVDGGALRLNVVNGEKFIPRLVEIGHEAGITVESISLHRPTLHDVFLHYTGREFRSEEAETMGFARAWVRRGKGH